MAGRHGQGTVISFAPKTLSGILRLEDGRLVELPRFAVEAAGLADLVVGDRVSVHVNNRLDRYVATRVILERPHEVMRPRRRQSRAKAKPEALDVRERVP